MLIIKTLGSIVISASIIGAMLTSMDAFQDDDKCIGVCYILLGFVNLLGLMAVVAM